MLDCVTTCLLQLLFRKQVVKFSVDKYDFLRFPVASISKILCVYIEFCMCWLSYFLLRPSANTSDRRDINRYAGLSTDHIVSGMSSHEIAIAIFPCLV